MRNHRRTLVALALALGALCGLAWALKTQEVEFGRDGVYEGAATISIDTENRMVFRDADVTAPTTLQALTTGQSDHGGLTGLGDDDHSQYLTSGRHATAHTAAHNGALAIPADTGGNATLGEHTSDASIHVSRDAEETISGNWQFSGAPEFSSGGVRFSNGGASGNVQLEFEDGDEDATLRWLDSPEVFALNRKLVGTQSDWTTLRTGDATVTGNLSGRDELGDRSGAIEGFVTIEGLDPSDMLGRARDETISGNWTFSGALDVGGAVEVAGSGAIGSGRTGAPSSRILSIGDLSASGLGSWKAGIETAQTLANLGSGGGYYSVLSHAKNTTAGANFVVGGHFGAETTANCAAVEGYAGSAGVKNTLGAVTVSGNVRGAYSEVTTENSGTKAVAAAIGMWIRQSFTGGAAAITNSYGLKIDTNATAPAPSAGSFAAATVTNHYGVYVAAPTNGAISNEYGVYVENPGSGANEYALYLAGGKAKLGGETVVPDDGRTGLAGGGGGIAFDDQATDIVSVKDAAFLVERASWKWQAACAGAGMNAAGKPNPSGGDIALTDFSPLGFQIWRPESHDDATCLRCDADGVAVLFPIHGEPGTVLGAVRFKYQALGEGDGIQIRVVKRDETSATAAWTEVGSAQEYVDTSSPYEVTVTSAYSIPGEEEIDGDHSYCIEVKSVTADTGVRLYAYGIETMARGY